MGYLSTGVYGLKGYATNGTTVVFELSDSQQLIGGFTFTDTQLSAISGGNTSIFSSGATAFSAGPTGSPSVTISQAGAIVATSYTMTGGTMQTASGATSGVKYDTTSLRGYNAAGQISFPIDPATGNFSYSPNSMFGLFQVSITGFSSGFQAICMTSHGRYVITPDGTTNLNVWDTGADYNYNYTRQTQFTRSGLTVSPEVLCTVLDGTTERLIGFAAGGTNAYRYDLDGQNEAVISFSGTAITTGAQRIGYSPGLGYVYIQDGADRAATAVKRYTFSGTTLTYVDTVTLSVAPAAGGCRQMWIGAVNLAIQDNNQNSSRVTFQRYGRTTGTQTASVDWGHGTAGVGFMGIAARMDDNALLFFTEADTGAGTHALIQKILLD